MRWKLLRSDNCNRFNISVINYFMGSFGSPTFKGGKSMAEEKGAEGIEYFGKTDRRPDGKIASHVPASFHS